MTSALHPRCSTRVPWPPSCTAADGAIVISTIAVTRIRVQLRFMGCVQRRRYVPQSIATRHSWFSGSPQEHSAAWSASRLEANVAEADGTLLSDVEAQTPPLRAARLSPTVRRYRSSVRSRPRWCIIPCELRQCGRRVRSLRRSRCLRQSWLRPTGAGELIRCGASAKSPDHDFVEAI